MLRITSPTNTANKAANNGGDPTNPTELDKDPFDLTRTEKLQLVNVVLGLRDQSDRTLLDCENFRQSKEELEKRVKILENLTIATRSNDKGDGG